MFDSGRGFSLISTEASNFLGLNGVAVNIQMLTAGGCSTNLRTKLVDLKVSFLSREATYDIFLVLVMNEFPLIGLLFKFSLLFKFKGPRPLKGFDSSFPAVTFNLREFKIQRR